MLTHLVKVPLTLRPTALTDIAALKLLQSNSGSAPQASNPPTFKHLVYILGVSLQGFPSDPHTNGVPITACCLSIDIRKFKI